MPNVNFTIPLEDQVKAAQGVPAFIRRARLLEILDAKLDGKLARFHRREMKAVIPALKGVAALLREATVRETSPRRLRSAVSDLRERVRTYNARRASFLETVDLSEFNRAVDAYDRFYLIEREAWCRSARGERLMVRWSKLSPADLEAKLPPLPSP